MKLKKINIKLALALVLALVFFLPLLAFAGVHKELKSAPAVRWVQFRGSVPTGYKEIFFAEIKELKVRCEMMVVIGGDVVVFAIFQDHMYGKVAYISIVRQPINIWGIAKTGVASESGFTSEQYYTLDQNDNTESPISPIPRNLFQEKCGQLDPPP